MNKEQGAKKVLVAENGDGLCKELEQAFAEAGYELCSLPQARERGKYAEYALALIDGAHPDAVSLIRDIKKMLFIPVIVIAEAAEESEEISFFEQGADDYVARPFYPRALASRAGMHICRSARAALGKSLPCAHEEILTVRDLVIDTGNYRVTKKGAEIKLSKKEYEVLLHLAAHAGELMSREELLTQVWGYDGFFGDIRTVDVTMSRLRSKVEKDPSSPEYIFTKRTKGYYIAK